MKTALTFFLLLICFVIFYLIYYQLRANRLLGLKGYLDFSLPGCQDPLFFKPQEGKITDDKTSNWVTYKNEDRGYALKIPPNWEIKQEWECSPDFRDGCFLSSDLEADNLSRNWKTTKGNLIKGGRLNILLVEKNFNFQGEFLNSSLNYNNNQLLKTVFCRYPIIDGRKAVERFIGRPTFLIETFIDVGEYVYIMRREFASDDQRASDTLKNITETFRYLGIRKEQNIPERYSNKPSPQVPYQDLPFKEIDAYNAKNIPADFSENDYHQEDMPLDGYTFTASKNDRFIFRILWDNTPNLASVYTELYAYGPTVIKKENYFDFEVPVTGRYFLVVKSKPEWKYKPYRLEIKKYP